MKKIKKLMISIIMIFVLLILLAHISLAAEAWVNGKISGTDNWASGKGDSITSATEKTMGTAIQVIRIVGTGISIIMISYIGIKYMTVAPDEKASFKKSATAFIVGAVILFAGSSILGIIADFANSATTATSSTTTTWVRQ